MKNKKTLIVLSIFCVLFIFACTSEKQNFGADKKEIREQVQENPYANAKISIKVIPSVNKTFGYDILVSGRPLIHQPSIPGLPGNDGFTSRERAQKVAEFVVKKIRNNEMPPTVTIDDLKKMNVLK